VSCRDKCRELGFEDAIEYGITRKYVETRRWGIWEVFREIIQNALDEIHEVENRLPRYYPCKSMSDGVVIYDEGRGLGIRHLLIGTSEKKSWQRGKFGEGLKLALLAATHLGVPVIIHSGDKIIQPTFVTKVIEGVPIDLFCICHKSASPITGTRVFIGSLDLCVAFRDRIVQGIYRADPDCIKYEYLHGISGKEGWYDVIDPICTRGPSIYVRDIYVTSFREAFRHTACFSYNLYNVEIDESRRIPAGGSVIDEIRNIWSFIARQAADDRKAYELLKRFLLCAIEGCKAPESDVPFETDVNAFYYATYGKAKEAIAKAFNELYGEDVVILFSSDLIALAEYLGIRYISCPYALGSSLQDITGSVQRIKKLIEKTIGNIIPKEQMPPELVERINILEEIVRILFSEEIHLKGVKIAYAMLKGEPGKIREMWGMYDKPTNTVLMNYAVMAENCMGKGAYYAYKCMSWYLSVVSHELAHAISGAPDLSEEFQSTLTDLAGKATTRAILYSEMLSQYLKDYYRLFGTG